MKYILSALYFILCGLNIVIGVIGYTHEKYTVSVLMFLSGILFFIVWFSNLIALIDEDKED